MPSVVPPFRLLSSGLTHRMFALMGSQLPMFLAISLGVRECPWGAKTSNASRPTRVPLLQWNCFKLGTFAVGRFAGGRWHNPYDGHSTHWSI